MSYAPSNAGLVLGMPVGIFEPFYNTIPLKCDTIFEGPLTAKNAEKYVKSLSKIVENNNFTSNPSILNVNSSALIQSPSRRNRLQSLLSVSPHAYLSADLQSLFMHVNLYTLHTHA